MPRNRQDKSRTERLVLVTGATGYVGGRLVPMLLANGYSVRCMARDPDRLQGRGWIGAEIVRGDVLDPPSLLKALEGVTDAFYLIHSMAAGPDFGRWDRQAADLFQRTAARSHLERIVYLGGLAQPHPELSPHLQSRLETGEVLRQGPVPVTEFRAAVIVGSGSLSFELIRYLAERLPILICPKWVQTRCQPIGVRNVLQYLTASLQEPRSVGRVIEIGGADVLSYRDMMVGYAQERGLARLVVNVPVLTPRLSSYWIDRVTPIPSTVARHLIEGLRNEAVCRNRAALDLFAIEPMTYREAVRRALDRVRTQSVETVWWGAVSATPFRPRHEAVALRDEEGLIREERVLTVRASAEQVFKVMARIGGEQGWYYANWLWRLRGAMDRALGGVGFRLGRRHPEELRVGDTLDFWRVEVWDRPRRIRLRAEMRLPGQAWLQFDVAPQNAAGADGVVVKQTAFFEPRGLPGLAYWYGLYPLHRMIFSGMVAAIRHRAESAARAERTSHGLQRGGAIP